MAEQQPEVVIMGDDGTEHVFPPGFDPKQAAGIVRNAQMYAANQAAAEPPAVPREGGSGTNAALGAVSALRAAPAVVAGVRALATPENFGRVSAVSGLVKAGSDLYHGHPIDALEHAVLGYTPGMFMKVVKTMAANAPKPASTLEYAKAAGEHLNPANIVAAPQVGGAVDQFASSMNQRVVRVLGPNGEIVSSAAQKAPGIVARTAAPVARALPLLQAIAGGQSLTAMADNPGRTDNPFLGIGVGAPRSEADQQAHPALINALIAKLRSAIAPSTDTADSPAAIQRALLLAELQKRSTSK